MISILVFLIGFLAAFQSGDATITDWTSPLGITASTINGTATPLPFAENATTAVTATFTVTGQTVDVAYSFLSQSISDHFAIDSTSGVLTLASGKTLDYETTTSYTVKVCAIETGANTATATLVITVTDVNDNPPIFNPTSYSATVVDGAVAATSVITVNATDADGTATNNVITYSIISGDDTVGKFTFDGAVVKVATGQTLSRATTSCYTLVVHAIDSSATGKLTGITTVSVCVGSASECPCSSATTIATSVISLLVALVVMIL